MLIAVMYNGKKVHWFEFMFGTFISLGMVLFAVADFQVYPKFDFIGERQTHTYELCFADDHLTRFYFLSL